MQNKFDTWYKKMETTMKKRLGEYAKECTAAHQTGVILYGAGGRIHEWIQLLSQENIPVKAICDGNTQKHGTTVQGTNQTVQPLAAEAVHPDTPVIITTIVGSYYFEMCEAIYKINPQARIIKAPSLLAMCPSLWRNGEETYWDFFCANKKRFQAVYEALADEKSREVFEKVLYGRAFMDFNAYAAVCQANQYFDHEIVKWKEKEVFIDGGAYTGDTIAAFQAQYSNMGEGYRVEAFEPSPIIFKKLQANIKGQQIRAHCAGLYDQSGTVAFAVDAYGASHVYHGGAEQIQVVKLDEICQDATFIKLDVEGCELQALKGAEQNIRRNAPTLACCVYHKDEDFFEIYEYIKAVRPEYQIYLRHYTKGICETVMYAVQQE